MQLKDFRARPSIQQDIIDYIQMNCSLLNSLFLLESDMENISNIEDKDMRCHLHMYIE